MNKTNPVLHLKEILDHHHVWEGEFTRKRNESAYLNSKEDTNLYYVLDGSLRAFISNHEEDQIIRFGYAGSFIGSLTFFGQTNTSLQLQVLREARLLYVSRKRLHHFFATKSEYFELWQELLQVMIIQQFEREVDLLCPTPAERYRRVLDRSPHLFQAIPHKYIASYLRMTPETLSRLKKS